MNLPDVQAGKRRHQIRTSLPVATAVRVLINGLFISTILMAALVFGSSALPALFGYNTMVVTSGSMEPAIRVGDAVIMRPPSPGAVRIGDVITFKPFGSLGLVTHRVVATSEIEGNLYFQTQGDANATPDPDLTSAEAVFGKAALTLPKMGFLLHFAATPRGKILLIALPLFVLMVREVRGYFGSLQVGWTLLGSFGRGPDALHSRPLRPNPESAVSRTGPSPNDVPHHPQKVTIDLASAGRWPDASLESAKYRSALACTRPANRWVTERAAGKREGAMTHSDSGGARGDEAEPQVPSGETEADTDIDSSSTVNGYSHEGSGESEHSCVSHSDAVAEIVFKAEQLAKGVREIARRDADWQTLETLAKAEIKAREQILDPAAAQAASKSQEIMARGEREAEAILSGVKRLFGLGSDADYAGDSSTVGGPDTAANGSTSEGPLTRPPTISSAPRDQLKAVIARRALEP